MISNDFLEIRYDAFAYNGGVEDFKEIEYFKEEINKHYNNIVKANSVGRGGRGYELLIHFICNLNLLDYFNHIVILYLGSKTIDQILDKSLDKLLEKYLFIPLQANYKRFKEVNPTLDCYSFQSEFKDANIFIYKLSSDSIFSNLNKIIEQISVHIKNLAEINNLKITEIYIPAILDVVGGQKFYRTPLGEQETMILNDKVYFSFWGVRYHHSQLSAVYDLNSKSILDGYRFYTEKEFSVIVKNQKN